MGVVKGVKNLKKERETMKRSAHHVGRQWTGIELTNRIHRWDSGNAKRKEKDMTTYRAQEARTEEKQSRDNQGYPNNKSSEGSLEYGH